MPNRTCTHFGCDSPLHGRDLCPYHYRQALQNGTLPPSGRHQISDIDPIACMATCSICGRTKVRILKGKNTGKASCGNRINEYRRGQRSPREKTPPLSQREQRLRAKYGLSQAEYDAMFAAQGGLCGICDQTSPELLHVDHCHTTGRVRGLLCRPCNLALGYLRDDPVRMWAAINYLAREQVAR